MIRVALSLLLGLCSMPAWSCGVALHFLLDGSSSFSEEERRDVVAAHIVALRSDRVLAAIQGRGAAFAASAFAGLVYQIVPWTVVRNAADIERVTALLEPHARSSTPYLGGGTATGSAVMHALESFRDAPACERQVVDVATDGESNAGVPVDIAREAAERAGVVINAVTLRTAANADPGAWAREMLVTRETDEAIAGFVIEAEGFEAFVRAIPRKVREEIALNIPPK